MKRQILTLFTVLTLSAFSALMAQTPSNTALAPSQQVDQSGKPETGPGPDVDVDAGRNASNGVLDVQVNKQTDPDTSAKGPNDLTTGTTTATATETTTTAGTGSDGNLPGTASDTPLFALVGFSALAGFAALRLSRRDA